MFSMDTRGTMTTQTPSAAHLPDAPASVRYRLSCEVTGRVWPFSCLPADLAAELRGLLVYGLTDVCAEALAFGVQAHPERPARYGPCLVLEVVR